MVFSNQALICGIAEDDYNNSDWVLNNMEKFDPECMVLGTMSYTDIEKFKHGHRKYYYPPLYEPVLATQTMATKPLNSFITNEMDISMNFFHDGFEDSTIFMANHTLKRKVALPELSLAKVFNSRRRKQLFFGNPNPLFTIEDIALSYSLDELRNIFFDNIDYYEKKSEKGVFIPQTEPIDYKFNFHQAILTHKSNLFTKQMMYKAAVSRKILKLYKKVGLT